MLSNYYNYYRDYSPEIGRYVQSDPIGLRGGINTYGYVDGNPILLADQLGLAVTDPWSRTNSGGAGMGGGLILIGILNAINSSNNSSSGTSGEAPSNVIAFPGAEQKTCPPPDDCEKNRLRLEGNKKYVVAMGLVANNNVRLLQQYNLAATVLNNDIHPHNALCPAQRVEPLPLMSTGPTGIK